MNKSRQKISPLVVARRLEVGQPCGWSAVTQHLEVDIRSEVAKRLLVQQGVGTILNFKEISGVSCLAVDQRSLSSRSALCCCSALSGCCGCQALRSCSVVALSSGRFAQCTVLNLTQHVSKNLKFCQIEVKFRGSLKVPFWTPRTCWRQQVSKFVIQGS